MTLDDLFLRVQRAIDRLVRRLRLGAPPVAGQRRLLLVQIDGLSRGVLEKALARGHMPVLRQLLGRGGHQLFPMMIETTAPLADRSEESVKAAVTAAIDKAVRGASAMGFAWFQLRDAQVSGNEVAIQILATDGDPGQVDEVDPGTGPDATGDDEDLAEGPVPGLPVAETSRLHI